MCSIFTDISKVKNLNLGKTNFSVEFDAGKPNRSSESWVFISHQSFRAEWLHLNMHVWILRPEEATFEVVKNSWEVTLNIGWLKNKLNEEDAKDGRNFY